MFFIHNPGPSNEKCLVVRPNTGKKLEYKKSLRTKFNKGVFVGGQVVDVESAMKIWEREYKLADRPYSELYQVSCPGRHQEDYVVSKSVEYPFSVLVFVYS